MHGTILVFFVLTAGLSGTFANLLIPLQIGARDMASPFMNMLSYWFFFAASVLMFISLFVQTGPASGGWTTYPPLSALKEASLGSGIGMDLWLGRYVPVRCLVAFRWSELRKYSSEHAYKGHEYDPPATDYMGTVLYRGT